MSFLVYEATGPPHAIAVISTLSLLLCHVKRFLDEVLNSYVFYGMCGNWAGRRYNITQKQMAPTMSCSTFS